MLARWLAEVGLTGLRDVHSFRRRAAGRLTQLGVPAELGRRILGHASASQFDAYAERAQLDLSPQRRMLWVRSPLSGPTLDQLDHTAAGEAPDVRYTPDAPAPSVDQLAQFVGPAFRGWLAGQPCDSRPLAVLRDLFGGGAG